MIKIKLLLNDEHDDIFSFLFFRYFDYAFSQLLSNLIIIETELEYHMINIKDIFQQYNVDINASGFLALREFTYEYAKTLISKCICSGSLKEKKLNKTDLISIFDAQRLVSQPSIAGDLLQRLQKSIDAVNQNRLDDFQFKESLSISLDKVNFMDGIQSIRLKKFNSVHLMITKNSQLLISQKQDPKSSITSQLLENEQQQFQSQSQASSEYQGEETISQGEGSPQNQNEAETSQSSIINESISEESLLSYSTI